MKLRFNFKERGMRLWKVTKDTVLTWWAMDPFRESAVIAYYAVFSLPALLVIVITVAGFAFGAEAVHGKVLQQVQEVMGQDTADQVKEMLIAATKSKTSVIATIIGIFTVLLGSVGVFLQLQKTLNIIWEVKEVPQKGIWGFFRTRLFSFGLILSIAFLLMVSLVVSTVITAASQFLKADSSQFLVFVFQVINFLISLGVISLLFTFMFKFLPDIKISWKQVWLGGLITGVLFTIGKTALAFYFGKAEPGSGYGAAGSIILILLWVSYSSMILFLGAEFTHQFADKNPEAGANGEPKEFAKVAANTEKAS
jgi:membrane protein